MSASKHLDTEIMQHLSKLNAQQKEIVLSFVKTLADEEPDWWDNVEEAVKASIEKGLKEIDQGKVTPHKEVMKKYKKWLSRQTSIAMELSDIQKLLHQYVDNADDKLLTLLLAIAQGYDKEQDFEYQFTDEEIQLFDQRRQKHLNGESKSYTVEEAFRLIRENCRARQ